MRILMFGDVVGRAGRSALRAVLPKLKEKYELDLVIANGENLAHGIGITRKTLQSVLDAGVDVVTSGNHIFNKKEALELLKDKDLPLIRPANYPPGVPGRGHLVKSVRTKRVLIVNLVGRVFFNEDFDCPFRTLDQILKEHEGIQTIIVDAHTEATSEIKALGLYFDGRVSAMLGTHTHIPCADWQILKNGAAYISDIGMVGVKDSIIGMKKEPIFERFLTQVPIKFEVQEEGRCEVNGVVVEIDDKTGKAKKIEKIYEETEV